MIGKVKAFGPFTYFSEEDTYSNLAGSPNSLTIREQSIEWATKNHDFAFRWRKFTRRKING